MEPIQGIERHRESIAAELRRLREQAGVSGSELARRIGWTQSRVSRYERGLQTPSVEEVSEFAEGLALSKSDKSLLISAIQALDSEWNDYRSIMLRGGNQRQGEIQASEKTVTEIRSFQQTLIPGLLQTSEYMYTLTELANYENDEVRNDAVELRMERQKILEDKSKSFWFVITEAVLWNRFGSTDVMSEQFEKLLTFEKIANVHFGIVPKTALLQVFPFSPFTIHDQDFVKIETTASEIVLKFPHDVQDHLAIFNSLRQSAVAGKQARRIIEEAAESLL